MNGPFYADEDLTLWHGDAATVLATLPEGSARTCVTSPPYFHQRDYDTDGQLGSEPTVGAYVAALVDVLEQVRRVLTDDGTVWLNLGDGYAHSRPSGPAGRTGRANRRHNPTGAGGTRDLPDKNLLGTPWRVAFALQDAGWVLRNDVIWFKRNAMPTSTADRFSNRYEHVFLLSKGPRYYFDLGAVRVPHRMRPQARPHGRHKDTTSGAGHRQGWSTAARTERGYDGHPDGANPGDVWDIPTRPSRDRHIAMMPADLARRCVLAGSAPGDTVLDPFSGSGTTGQVATDLGRQYVGIDLNATYLADSLHTRLAQGQLDLPVGNTRTTTAHPTGMNQDDR